MGINLSKVGIPNNDDKEGYCIRTRKSIPLDHERPYSSKAYADWLDKGGVDTYGEKYDHFTGEESHGKTCFATPILNKNWHKYLKVTDRFPFG